MEAVAPDTAFGNRARQSQHLSNGGLGAVESRIEAGNLREVGIGFSKGADRCQVVGLV